MGPWDRRRATAIGVAVATSGCLLLVEPQQDFTVGVDAPPSVRAVRVVFADSGRAPTDVAPATARDALACAGSASDPEGAPVRLTLTWWVDGEAVRTTEPASIDALTQPDHLLAAPVGVRGTTVACELSASDGTRSGDARSADVVLGNAAPTLGQVRLTPEDGGVATVTSTLVCAADPPDDPDGDPLTVRFAWRRVGANGDEAPIEAPDTQDALAAGFFKGDRVTCTATASDGEDAVSASSPALTIDNVAPALVGAVTLQPDPVAPGQVATCAATATDADGPPPFLAWAWTLVRPDGAELLLPDAAPTLTVPDAASATPARKGDTLRCVVTATDPESAQVSGAATVAIGNAAPQVSAVSIQPVRATGDTGPATAEDRLEAVADATDPDGDPVTLTVRWTVDGAPVPARLLDGDRLAPGAATRGQTVTATVRADDPDGASASGTGELRIGNAPPRIDAVSITPAQPTQEDTLQAIASFSDPDQDALVPAYQWLRNDLPIGGAVGQALVLPSIEPAVARGDRFGVRVVVTDGQGGTATDQASVTFGNLPPVATGLTFQPATPTVVDALTATALAVDPDGEVGAITWAYAWTRNGTPISGATGPTLDLATLPDVARGDLIGVVATPTDGDGAPGFATSASTAVVNAPPTVGAATLSRSSLDATSVVTCQANAPSDADGDPVRIRYAWFVGPTVDAAALSDDDLVATTATIDGGLFDKGDRVLCRVTPTDGIDDGPSRSTAAVPVDNALPRVGGVQLQPVAPTVQDAIVAVVQPAVDADGDEVMLDLVWNVAVGDTVTQPIVLGDTLPAGTAPKGSRVWADVTPRDPDGAGPTVTSAPRTVVNSPPQVVSVTPLAASVTAPAEAGCVVDVVDPDGDAPLAYAWTWTGVTGTPWTDAAPTSTLPTAGGAVAGLADAASVTVGCQVTASDADDTSAPGSALLTVRNGRPALTSVTLTPTSPTRTTTIRAGWTVSDPEDNAVGTRFRWTIDGQPISGATSASLVPGSVPGIGANAALQVFVTPFDDYGDGPEIGAPPVLVRNQVPTVDLLYLSPFQPTTTDTLAPVFRYGDPDPGDPLTLTFTWTVDGAVVQTGTAPDDTPVPGVSTLDGSHFSKGQLVALQMQVTDEAGATVFDVATITIVNAKPGLPVVETDPTFPWTDAWRIPSTVRQPGLDAWRGGIDCRIAEPAVDPDGDPVSYRFGLVRDSDDVVVATAERWVRRDDGTGPDGRPARIHQGLPTPETRAYRCRVTVSDDLGFSSEGSVDSEPVTPAYVALPAVRLSAAFGFETTQCEIEPGLASAPDRLTCTGPRETWPDQVELPWEPPSGNRRDRLLAFELAKIGRDRSALAVRNDVAACWIDADPADAASPTVGVACAAPNPGAPGPIADPIAVRDGATWTDVARLGVGSTHACVQPVDDDQARCWSTSSSTAAVDSEDTTYWTGLGITPYLGTSSAFDVAGDQTGQAIWLQGSPAYTADVSFVAPVAMEGRHLSGSLSFPNPSLVSVGERMVCAMSDPHQVNERRFADSRGVDASPINQVSCEVPTIGADPGVSLRVPRARWWMGAAPTQTSTAQEAVPLFHEAGGRLWSQKVNPAVSTDAVLDALVPVDADERYAWITAATRDRACGVTWDGRARCVSPEAASFGELAAFDLPGRHQQVRQIAVGGCYLSRDVGRVDCWNGLSGPELVGQETLVTSRYFGNSLACTTDDAGLPTCWRFSPSFKFVPDTPTEALDAVGVGVDGLCGIRRRDGHPVCWSGDWYDLGDEVEVERVSLQDDVPSEPVVDLSVYDELACAVLASDGAIRCWGADAATRLVLPATGWVDVEVGRRQVCGRQPDGRAYCIFEGSDFADFPVAVYDALAIGYRDVCALREDGEILCTTNGGTALVDDAAPGPFVDLMMDDEMVCGIRLDGTFACWGERIRWTTAAP